jgi:hypothetical protein
MMEANDKIIDRIRKLFALAESPNEAEAMSAMEKAHALLLQYNLTVSDLKEEKVTEINEMVFCEAGKMRAWKKVLIYYVTKANYCASYTEVTRGSYKYDVKGKQVIKIVGREANVISAKDMLEYIFESIERLSRNIDHDMKESYKTGFSEALCKRLKEIHKAEEEKVETCTALTVIDSELKNHMDQKNLRNSTIKQNIKDAQGYMRGQMDGSSFSLNKQVKGNNANAFIE